MARPTSSLAAAAVAAVLVLVTPACGAARSAATHLATDCEAESGTQLALTRNYRFALRVGPVEGMLMPYQVKANHVKHGEVMLRGHMVIPMHGPLRHLEVHICSKENHAVVADAHPSVSLADDTRGGQPKRIPIAVMEGIAEGRADLHYGNTVAMPHHHRFTITVTTAGQRASFHVVAP